MTPDLITELKEVEEMIRDWESTTTNANEWIVKYHIMEHERRKSSFVIVADRLAEIIKRIERGVLELSREFDEHALAAASNMTAKGKRLKMSSQILSGMMTSFTAEDRELVDKGSKDLKISAANFLAYTATILADSLIAASTKTPNELVRLVSMPTGVPNPTDSRREALPTEVRCPIDDNDGTRYVEPKALDSLVRDYIDVYSKFWQFTHGALVGLPPTVNHLTCTPIISNLTFEDWLNLNKFTTTIDAHKRLLDAWPTMRGDILEQANKPSGGSHDVPAQAQDTALHSETNAAAGQMIPPAHISARDCEHDAGCPKYRPWTVATAMEGDRFEWKQENDVWDWRFVNEGCVKITPLGLYPFAKTATYYNDPSRIRNVRLAPDGRPWPKPKIPQLIKAENERDKLRQDNAALAARVEELEKQEIEYAEKTASLIEKLAASESKRISLASASATR